MFMAVLIAGGCTGGHKYSGYSNIDPSGWCYGETCDFTVALPDSVATGYMLLSLTHDNSYAYSNLWVEVTYDSGSRHMVDTVNVPMCDAYGNWYGKGMPGHYQLTDTITLRPVTLTDSSRVTVRHIMRVDTLRGISQVGLEFRD